MILKSIELHNFRLYPHILIDFKKDISNITIIKGDHGVGKTTLLNAISWCLYGSELLSWETSLGICNNKTVNLAEVGEKINVSVKLTFDDEGSTLVFHRYHEFQKGKNGLLPLDNEIKVLKIDEKESTVYNYAIESIEGKIPMKFRDYYLIRELFLDESFIIDYFNPFIESYSNPSQINTIQSSIHHLKRTKLTLMSNQKSIDSKLEKINEKINDIKCEITEVDEKKKRAQLEKKEILEKINETKLKLDNYPNVHAYFDRKIELENLIEKNNFNLDNLKEELKEHILTKYPYIFSYESLNKFIDACQKSKETINHIGPAISIIREVNEFEDISNNLHQKISQIENDQEFFINEKLKIEEFLSAVEDNEIKRLLYIYQNLNSYKHSKETEIQNYSDTIKDLNEKLNVQLKNRDDEKENLFKELKHYQKKISFCEEAINVATDILTDLRGNRLNRFETCINDMFLRFNPKYGKVIVNEEGFSLQYENERLVKVSELSNGENCILALCFILAIHKIYGLNIPIILDTPFSRLDNHSRIYVSQSLIQLSQEKQIILLLNSEEYSKECQDILKDNVKTFEIEYELSEEGQESMVILNE